MWHNVSNGVDIRPADVDETSSKIYVYVRRNIRRVEASGKGEDTADAHYEWEEMKIPREMWYVAEKVLGHDTALDDVYAALTELAEMIVEG